jgi:hypothetical protein
MVALDIWAKKHWLRLHKRRLKWQDANPGKFYRSPDPFETEVSRYTCALCGERRYYRTNGSDKDVPQYHQVGKRFLTLCHACWHLKGIYKKHQKEKSLEGLSGCRVCQLQLALKRARKRSVPVPVEDDIPEFARPRQAKSDAVDGQPTRVYRSVGLSSGRNGRGNVARKRPAGRGSR